MPLEAAPRWYPDEERRRRELAARFPETGNENEPWLSAIISPERLAEVRRYPAYEGHTDEWIIMEALLATIVEKGPELPAPTRTRLRNLIGIFRMLSYQNLTPGEQAFIDEWSQATTFDARSLSFEANPEATADIHWLWDTFHLRRPPSQPDQNALLLQP